MKQHQELKAKIDGRSKTIQQCADLGKILIAAGNPASEEVRLTNYTVHINYYNATRKLIKFMQYFTEMKQYVGVVMIAICLSPQIKEKLDSLLSKQKDLVEKWDKHQEKLQHSE